MFGKRILILIPHPDDEVVGCYAAIGRAQLAGATVFALYLTHGCLVREILWVWQRKHYEKIVERRRAEAEAVATSLNITPVSWNARPARHLWCELPRAYAEIAAAVAAHGIDQIWVPAYEGGNADHDGLNALGRFFTDRLSVLEFAEYNFSGGRTHSQEFPYPNGTEQILKLTPQEQEKKRQALATYQSEKLNLNYVNVLQECYRPLAVYDYTRPPHPGTLWYARFQWVPFRHPRVDFTRPKDVCAAIAAFKPESTQPGHSH